MTPVRAVSPVCVAPWRRAQSMPSRRRRAATRSADRRCGPVASARRASHASIKEPAFSGLKPGVGGPHGSSTEIVPRRPSGGGKTVAVIFWTEWRVGGLRAADQLAASKRLRGSTGGAL